MTLKEKLQAELKNLDTILEDRKLRANKYRNTGNDLRAIYLEGEYEGLSRAYRYIQNILDGEE